MQQFLTVAERAAIRAGDLIRARFGDRSQFQVSHKGRIDLVTEVDLASEAVIREVLLEAFPNHAILGEEGGIEGDASGPLWIVDPLDGTRSFAHGYPFVAVSIALEIDGVIEVGVVHDPVHQETFSAVRGGGATLNGKPIRVSAPTTLDQALMVSGFPYNLTEIDYQPLFDLFRDMVLRSGGIRRDGAAALDFAYLACGRLDGFWEFFLKPWDAAAGSLLVAEAGGTVSAVDGTPFDVRRPEVLASNGSFHTDLIAVAAPYLEAIRRCL